MEADGGLTVSRNSGTTDNVVRPRSRRSSAGFDMSRGTEGCSGSLLI